MLSLTQMIGNTVAAVLGLRVLVIPQMQMILNARCEEDQMWVFHLRRRDMKTVEDPNAAE